MNRSLWDSTPRWFGLGFVIASTVVLLAETVFTGLTAFWSVVTLYGEPPDWVDVTTAAVSLWLAAISGLAYGSTLAVFFLRRRLLLVGIGYALPFLVAGLAVYFLIEAADPHPSAASLPWREITPYVATPLWWLPILALVVVAGIEIRRGIRRTNS
jgi:hypothetical protein